MNRKEFFGALLLVSMVSSIMLAGFVSSGGGPQISVKPTSGKGDSQIDSIKGTGWTPYTPVITLYWDQQDLNHTIANVTADRFGKFEIEDLEVEGSYIGKHTIIAVQDPIKATATYTMTVTTTPDDRILGPIQQLEDKLDNTTSGLPGIQANLSEILNDLADKPAIFETDNGFGEYVDGISRLQNGTYFIDVWSTGNFIVKAVYVDIQPHSGSIGVTYQNITCYSYIDDQCFNIPCRTYTPAPAYQPTEVLSGMKVETSPAASARGDILIAVKLSGISNLSYYGIYVEAIVEAGQSSRVFVDFTQGFEPDSIIH